MFVLVFARARGSNQASSARARAGGRGLRLEDGADGDWLVDVLQDHVVGNTR